MMDKIDLQEFLESAGKEIESRIERAKFYQHPSGVGDAREDVVREYMREVLPLRFSVDKGKIMDKDGHLSREFDVIISESSEVSPIMNLAGRRIVPIEAVYGVIEIKSVLDQDGYNSFIDAVIELDEMKRFYDSTGINLSPEEKEILVKGLGPQKKIKFVGTVWSGIIAFDGPEGETINDYLSKCCEGFFFICISGREFIMPWSETRGYAGLQLGMKSLPMTLWVVMELVTKNIRHRFFKPNYSQYRKSITDNIGRHLKGMWTSTHENREKPD